MSDVKRRLVVLDPVPASSGERSSVASLLEDDHFHDQCGVFGVYDHPEAANMTYLGLHALQHRGQESAGIVTTDGEKLYAHRAMGLVQDSFTQEQLAKLPGRVAIGHVRYSTAGGSHIKNAQPIAVDYARGSLAMTCTSRFAERRPRHSGRMPIGSRTAMTASSVMKSSEYAPFTRARASAMRSSRAISLLAATR